MGFRFRKSIPIGKHFRINLSKSGVGYSWGVKGARFTKTANGKNRTTLSVPGTGISYTTESKAHTSKEKPSKKKKRRSSSSLRKTASAANSRRTKSAYQQRTNEKLTQHHFVQNHISGFVLDHCDSHLADFLIHLVFEDRQHKKAQQDRKDLSTGSLLDRFLHHRRNRGYAKRAGGHPAFRPDLQNHFQSIAGSDCIVGTDSDPRAVSDAGADKHACSRNGQAACSTIASTARYTKQQRHAGKHFRFRRTNRTSARK